MSVPESVPFTEVLLVGVPEKAITKCLCVIYTSHACSSPHHLAFAS